METKEAISRQIPDLPRFNPRLSIFYYCSKFFLIAKMLLNRTAPVRLKIFKRNIYFNNINCFRIIEEGVGGIDQAVADIYKRVGCFVDVGAHIGIKTIAFHEVNPEAECIMFEPIPTTCAFLRKNTRHISKSKIFEVAVSDREKTVPIFFDEEHLNASSLDEGHYYLNKNAKKTIKKHEVSAMPLDNFFELAKDKGRIYLKIDVEAEEEGVLKGAQNFLSKADYLEIEITQDKLRPLSETLRMINRNFNVIKADFLPGDGYVPKAVNLLIELC